MPEYDSFTNSVMYFPNTLLLAGGYVMFNGLRTTDPETKDRLCIAGALTIVFAAVAHLLAKK